MLIPDDTKFVSFKKYYIKKIKTQPEPIIKYKINKYYDIYFVRKSTLKNNLNLLFLKLNQNLKFKCKQKNFFS